MRAGMPTNTNRSEELEAKLERLRELLTVAPLPVLQHIRDIAERVSSGPVTRMRARTRARAGALPSWAQTHAKQGRDGHR